MKPVLTFLYLAVTSSILFVSSMAVAAESPKLAAPLYKEVVPAIPADGIAVDPFYIGNFGGMKALDCQGTTESHDIAGKAITAEEAKQSGESSGPWCFLTRDSIDKVKAFYDKAVGPMHVIKGTVGKAALPVLGYAAYTERAWFPGNEESSPGFGYAGVSLHSLPAPPVRGKEAKNTDDTWEGQEAFRFYSETRHFGGFIDAVDWFGDPSKRKPEELHAFYEKHNRLESALFQRKGPKSEPVDETLRARFTKQREQEMNKALSMMTGQVQMPYSMNPLPADQHGTPEDEEFTAFMRRNPEVAQRYVELTKKIGALMQQGRFEEADAADEELQQLTASHPELAALERRAEERSAAASAAGKAQEDLAIAGYQKQQDKAIWGTWQEYIAAAEKEAYYTLIIIDIGFSGKEKDYSRDRSVFEEWTSRSAPHTQIFGFRYDEDQAAAGNSSTPSDSAPQPQPKAGDDVKENIMKGLKGLRNFF